MIIKYQALAQQLTRKPTAVYILIGQDHYLLNDAALMIKKTAGPSNERDDKTLDITSANDWNLLLSEANSYSLFAEKILLDVRYDKKTFDAAGKKIIQAYINNINPRCLILMRAPQLPNKQLQWLASHEHVTIVQVSALPAHALQAWIENQLKLNHMQYEPDVPLLIHQYTQNNMLACAQLIEKVVLTNNTEEILTINLVKEHLIDQCDYPLYELADVCLKGQADKAIHFLRLASQRKGELTLILWILTQEIRQLIQLSHLISQSIPFSNACNQLKIWTQRMSLYEKPLKYLSQIDLHHLLQFSQQLDEQIKSGQNLQVWHGLEQLALGLCGNYNISKSKTSVSTI